MGSNRHEHDQGLNCNAQLDPLNLNLVEAEAIIQTELTHVILGLPQFEHGPPTA